jgi:hypothetical protein
LPTYWLAATGVIGVVALLAVTYLVNAEENGRACKHVVGQWSQTARKVSTDRSASVRE